MKFLETFETIKAKMQKGGFTIEAEKILQCQIALGTPGEVFACITFHLNNLYINSSPAYIIAKEEIDEIIKYAKSINYI